jgi:hypothetical protein
MALEIEYRDFRTPDELYVVERGRVEVVRIRGGLLRRFLLKPGWHSDGEPGDLDFGGPHLLYHAAGRIRFSAPRGQVLEAGPGQVVGLPPGWRGCVLGDDPVIVIDFFDIAASLWRSTSEAGRSPAST